MNFNKNGDVHRTVIGGIISLLIKAGFIWYAYVMLYRSIFREYDWSMNSVQYLNLAEMGAISLTDTNLTIFWNLSKQMG